MWSMQHSPLQVLWLQERAFILQAFITPVLSFCSAVTACVSWLPGQCRGASCRPGMALPRHGLALPSASGIVFGWIRHEIGVSDLSVHSSPARRDGGSKVLSLQPWRWVRVLFGVSSTSAFLCLLLCSCFAVCCTVSCVASLATYTCRSSLSWQAPLHPPPPALRSLFAFFSCMYVVVFHSMFLSLLPLFEWAAKLRGRKTGHIAFPRVWSRSADFSDDVRRGAHMERNRDWREDNDCLA